MKVMINQKDFLKGQVTVEFKPGGCFPPARLALGRIQLSNHQVITSVVVWVMIGTVGIQFYILARGCLRDQLVNPRNPSTPWILMSYESANSVRERTSNWGRFPPLDKVVKNMKLMDINCVSIKY